MFSTLRHLSSQCTLIGLLKVMRRLNFKNLLCDTEVTTRVGFEKNLNLKAPYSHVMKLCNEMSCFLDNFFSGDLELTVCGKERKEWYLIK